MLEKLIGDLIAALNANTEAVKNGAGKTPKTPKPAKEEAAAAQVVEPAKPAAEEKPAEPVYPTEGEVAAAANALMDANGNNAEAIPKLNVEFNVPIVDGKRRLSKAEPEKRVAIIAKLKTLTEEALKAKTDSGAI